MKRPDRFKEDYKKLQNSDTKLNEYLKEREILKRTGRLTQKVEAMIRYEVGNMEYDLKELEKLSFLYQKHP